MNMWMGERPWENIEYIAALQPAVSFATIESSLANREKQARGGAA